MEKINILGRNVEEVCKEIDEYLKEIKLDKLYSEFRHLKALSGDEIIPDKEDQIIVNILQESNDKERCYIFISTLNVYTLTDWMICIFNNSKMEDVIKVQNELIRKLKILW